MRLERIPLILLGAVATIGCPDATSASSTSASTLPPGDAGVGGGGNGTSGAGGSAGGGTGTSGGGGRGGGSTTGTTCAVHAECHNGLICGSSGTCEAPTLTGTLGCIGTRQGGATYRLVEESIGASLVCAGDHCVLAGVSP